MASNKKGEPRKLDVAHLEGIFGARLPPPYRNFITSGAYLKKNGWKAANLPGFDPAWALPVRFDAPAQDWQLEAAGLGREHKGEPLITVLFRDRDFYRPTRSKKPRPVPIATFRQGKDFDGSEFLAIDLHDPKGPVSLWTHDSGNFEQLAPTFEAFLDLLLEPSKKPDALVLKQALEKARELFRTDPGKGLSLLNRGLKPFEGKKKSEIHEDVLDPVGRALNIRGICLHKLKRFDDSLADFDRGMRLGSGFCALNLANDQLEVLKDYRSALKTTDRILNDMFLRLDLSEERASSVFSLRGVSLLCLGKEKEAREAYASVFKFLQGEEQAKSFIKELETHVIKKRLPQAGVASKLVERLEQAGKPGKKRPKKK